MRGEIATKTTMPRQTAESAGALSNEGSGLLSAKAPAEMQGIRPPPSVIPLQCRLVCHNCYYPLQLIGIRAPAVWPAGAFSFECSAP